MPEEPQTDILLGSFEIFELENLLTSLVNECTQYKHKKRRLNNIFEKKILCTLSPEKKIYGVKKNV